MDIGVAIKDLGNYDIEPGNADQSILPLRVATNESGAKMPPLARSVAQDEAVELLMRWVDEVVTEFADPDANTCGAGGTRYVPGQNGCQRTPCGCCAAALRS